MKKVSVLLVLLAALAMFAAPAQAGVAIYLSTTSFSNALSSGAVASSAGNTASYTNSSYNSEFNVSTLNVLKVGGAGPVAETDSSVLTIKNISNSTETLYVVLGANAFISPITPPDVTLTSSIGGSRSVAVSGGNITFQSYVNQSNTITNSGNTAGLQTISPVTVAYLNTASTTFTPLSAPYAVNQAIAVTLTKGESVRLAGTTDVTGGTAVTPEPATMTLWGIGLAACGFAARRRRNAKVA